MRRKKTSEKVKPTKDVNRPVVLDKEIIMQIRINHLEMDKLKSDLHRLGSEIKAYEKSALLARLDQRDIKNKIMLLEKEHNKFLDNIKKDYGVDIRNKTINPETYEVI